MPITATLTEAQLDRLDALHGSYPSTYFDVVGAAPDGAVSVEWEDLESAGGLEIAADGQLTVSR